MMNSILLYLVQSEQEIPTQPIANTAYCIANREIRIVDNMGRISRFIAPPPEAETALSGRVEQCEQRLTDCEHKLTRIYTYLTSFGGDANESTTSN